jgi:hypothetical protein
MNRQSGLVLNASSSTNRTPHLYLVTSTAWTALEHAVLRRPSPAGGAVGGPPEAPPVDRRH